MHSGQSRKAFQRSVSKGFAPRGLGATTTALSAADQIEVQRRYMLLGQTADAMRAWDIRRAIAALRAKELLGETRLHLVASREQAVNVLYASLFADGIADLELASPSVSHLAGPDYLNVLRFLDIPQALALAAERQPVKLTGTDPDKWSWTTQTAQRLGWPRERLSW